MATTKVISALEQEARANVKAANPGIKFTTKAGKAALVLEMAWLGDHASEEKIQAEVIDLRKTPKAVCPDMPSLPKDLQPWLDKCLERGVDPRTAVNYDRSDCWIMFTQLSGTEENKISKQFPNLFN